MAAVSDRPGSPTKREQILRAASALFLNQGFAGASMDALAREAGVSKATVYAHFASKEDLFEAMIERGSSERFSHLLDADLDTLAVEEALHHIAHDFVSVLGAPESMKTMRVVVGEAARLPELAARFYRAGPGRVLAAFTAYLARATARGALKVEDPRQAAEMFFGMIRGDFHLRAMMGLVDQPDSAALNRMADSAVALFLKAYRS